MKKTYLWLSVVGFLASAVLMLKVTFETGNVLLWTDPTATLTGAFENDIAGAFVVDLLVAVWMFFIWTWIETRRLNMPKPWVIWMLTLLFGVAGTLPLFLYKREAYLTTGN